MTVPAAKAPRKDLGGPPSWTEAVPPEPAQLRSLLATVEEVRRLNDVVSGTRPPADVLDRVTALVAEAREMLQPYAADESHQLAGHVDVPGRAHPISPPMQYDLREPDRVSGHVTFTRFHLGGGGAVHGGVLPLMFDELLARLAGSDGRARSRTACLRVDYRAIVPIERQIRADARLIDVDGRKIEVVGELTLDGSLLCEARALFVMLLPGQP